MAPFLLSAMLIVLLLVCGMLERYYALTPISELKRRARGGDGRASLLHEVARNGAYAKAYLNIISLVIFAVLVSYLAGKLSTLGLILAVFLIAGLWLIAIANARFIAPLAVKFAPWFAIVIVALKPYVRLLGKLAGKIVPSLDINQLYTKEDLVDLIERQRKSPLNRIEKTELDLALHALTFNEKMVKEYMTPRKVVRFVASDEPVSPILMNELHETGFSRFPVYLDDIDNIIGTLYLKSLVERKISGKVFSAMSTDVYEVSEKENLEDVLQKFLKTKHHLFIVKNEFAEVVGIITIEDVIEQILGRKIVDEFDAHEDMREFAEQSAKTT